jgi:uncharacterized protein YcnI
MRRTHAFFGTALTFVVAVAVAVAVAATAAQAHVTLEVSQAPVGASYKAVLRITHGCEGQATTKLSVDIPAGFVGVKPQPKPGWQIETAKGAYDRPYELMHRQVTEGVKTITWSGGSLPDDFYDEFVLVGSIDKALKPGGVLYFPVTQTCGTIVQRWSETPADAKGGRLERPAAQLKLLPATQAMPDMPAHSMHDGHAH